MSRITVGGAGQFQSPPGGDGVRSVVVLARSRWDLPWSEVQYLEAVSASEVAAPGMGQATLVYEFGDVRREDVTDYLIYPPIDLLNQYVLIQGVLEGGGIGVEPPVYWVGKVTEVSREDNGLGPNNEPKGTQTFTAYALDVDLDRRRIRGARVAQEPSQLLDINRTPKFNERRTRGIASLGNRSTNQFATGLPPEHGPANTFVFSIDGELWSNRDILRYIQAWHAPTLPPEGPAFVPVGQIGELQKIIGQIIPAEGVTFRDMINAVVDRRRGLGWCLRYDPDALDYGVGVHIFSHFENDITAGANTFAANQEQVSLDLTDDINIKSLVISDSDTNRYDYLIARGKPIMSCFTVGLEDGTLIEGWSADTETDYKTATGTDDAEANDQYRQQERFNRVYRTYRINPEFNWDTRDGGLSDPRPTANPVCDDDGTMRIPIFPAGYWNAYRSFERKLPIVETGLLSGDGTPQYRKPFVAILNQRFPRRYHFSHKPPSFENNNVPGLPAIGVTLADDELAFTLNANPNHMLAAGDDWNANASPTKFEPVYERDLIVATVAVRTDEHFEARQSLTPLGADGRVLVIPVPDAEGWWINQGTIVDMTEDGELRGFFDDQAVREDKQRLADVLGLASSFYGVRRASLSLTIEALVTAYPVGTLIKDVSTSGSSPTPIGTVVTRREWNFRELTTSIQTDWADIDFSHATIPPPRPMEASSTVMRRFDLNTGQQVM